MDLYSMGFVEMSLGFRNSTNRPHLDKTQESFPV